MQDLYHHGTMKPSSEFSFTGECSQCRASSPSGSGGIGKETSHSLRYRSLWPTTTGQTGRMLILLISTLPSSTIPMNGQISLRHLERSKLKVHDLCKQFNYIDNLYVTFI